jgi:RNA polymerase sigma-70 factor (ECF subfamily)
MRRTIVLSDVVAVEATAKLDSELPFIEAILDGDRCAFEDFVRRQHRWVRGVIFGVLGDTDRVDDVLQVVWANVWNQATTLTDPRRWRTWLYRLARNAAVDAGREITRRRHLTRGFLEASRVGTLRAGQPDSEQQEMVLQTIRALPALYREPFVLRHLEGWSYRQIAEVLEMPIDTVETRLVRARRHLREALKDRL